MIPPLSDTAAAVSFLSPRAQPRALLSMTPDQCKIDLLWCELQFSPPHARKVAALLALCDGSRDLAALSAALDSSPERNARLISTLYTQGVLMDACDEEVAADLCQQHLLARGRTLRAQMSATVDLLGGGLHRRKLLGSLVETYHFVAAASDHIGAALAHAPSGAIQQNLARLFADEWKHSDDLKRGLLHAGLSAQDLAQCQALPETDNVIRFLRVLGSTDLLSYGICAAINESPKSDSAIKETWDKIGRLGLLPLEAVAPFRGHELEDEASGHQSIAATIFSQRGTISGIEQRCLRQRISTFIGLQRACYLALQHFYQAPHGCALYKGESW